MMQCLGALSLRRLEVRCVLVSKPVCMFESIEKFQGSEFALASCCPNLEMFSYPCACDRGAPGDSFWKLWSTLPHIREATLGKAPPEWIVPRLLDRVSPDCQCTRCGSNGKPLWGIRCALDH